MKFKYTGTGKGIPRIPFDLILLNLYPRDKKLQPNEIIEIPDNHPQINQIIKGLDAHGHFERIEEKSKKSKTDKKGE